MSTRHRSNTPVATAALAVAAAVVIAASVLGTTEEFATTPHTGVDPHDQPSGVAMVVSKGRRDGSSILGFAVRPPEYHLDVSFTLPDECSARIGDDPSWPQADPICRGPEGLSGTIDGTGRTRAGEMLLVVATAVTADCYESVEPGMTWPTAAAGCELGYER